MANSFLRRALTPVGLAAALVMAACSSGGGTPPATSAPTGDAPAGSTTPTTPAAPPDGPLTVWVMGDATTNFDQLVTPFTQTTGIQVKTVAIPWDSVDQKMTAAIASGNGPDVVQIGLSKLRTYADTGALLTLDDATLANYPDLASSNFIDGIAGTATAIGGKVMSVPWISDVRVLFYRSDILSAAGITAPPATWDELRADAKTLTARGAGQYGYYIPQWDSPLPVEMTWAFGGDIVDGNGNIDFDTPAFRQAADLYTGLYADKSVPTNSDFDQTQGFVSGVAPMLVSGPYLAAAIKDAAPDLAGKWSVAELPKGTTDNTSLLAGSNMAVWAKTAHQAGALQLLDFLSQQKTQVTWYGLNGDLPTSKAALADPTLTADPLVAVYAAQLNNAKILPLVPDWDGQTGKALLDALNSIVLTGTDTDAALTSLFAATQGQSIN
ncbi:MAG: extracellular solute-binding protein [Micrococcales bacterium]|nr:extracellular solute-binding protein [Micrococcales bacterium]